MGKRKGRNDMAAKSANLYARIEQDVKEQAEVKIPTARPVDISRMNAETLDMEIDQKEGR